MFQMNGSHTIFILACLAGPGAPMAHLPRGFPLFSRKESKRDHLSDEGAFTPQKLTAVLHVYSCKDSHFLYNGVNFIYGLSGRE